MASRAQVPVLGLVPAWNPRQHTTASGCSCLAAQPRGPRVSKCEEPLGPQGISLGAGDLCGTRCGWDGPGATWGEQGANPHQTRTSAGMVWRAPSPGCPHAQLGAMSVAGKSRRTLPEGKDTEEEFECQPVREQKAANYCGNRATICDQRGPVCGTTTVYNVRHLKSPTRKVIQRVEIIISEHTFQIGMVLQLSIPTSALK